MRLPRNFIGLAVNIFVVDELAKGGKEYMWNRLDKLIVVHKAPGERITNEKTKEIEDMHLILETALFLDPTLTPLHFSQNNRDSDFVQDVVPLDGKMVEPDC